MSGFVKSSSTFSGDGVNVKVGEGAVFGMGNPLLDISAQVPKEFLDKYEVKLNNAILAEDKHQGIYEELVKDFKVEYVAGGATQNSIRICQWMLQSEGATSYVGAIGQDAFGKQLASSCKSDGVATYYYESDDTPTGTCAVLVNDAERSLVANLAAANVYKHEHTQSEAVQQVINKAKIYYIGGFFLSVPEGPQSMLSIAKHAAENNKIFCLNLSAPFLIDFFYDQMSSILPYTDFVFGNETEAQAFGKKQNWSCDIPEVALRLSLMAKESGARCRTVVITQGADPTIVARDGKVTLYPVPALSKENLVDTNGAGDAFVGGFLSRLARANNIEACVRAGNYAARVVVQRSGCTFPAQPDI